jgi:hypothetical protein
MTKRIGLFFIFFHYYEQINKFIISLNIASERGRTQEILLNSTKDIAIKNTQQKNSSFYTTALSFKIEQLIL